MKMKIMQISAVSSNSKFLSSKRNDNEEIAKTNQATFRACLKVASNAEGAIEGSLRKFREVCNILKQKLGAETLFPNDKVILRKITGEAKQIGTGRGTYGSTPGHWENRGGYGGNVFVRDTVKYGQYGEFERPAPAPYYPEYHNENLEIAINKSKTGFYYNDERSEEQIAEDLFNAYKHVRYLEHYAK